MLAPPPLERTQKSIENQFWLTSMGLERFFDSQKNYINSHQSSFSVFTNLNCNFETDKNVSESLRLRRRLEDIFQQPTTTNVMS